MAAGDEQEKGDPKKGFAGLSSMVSDVDSTVAQTAREPQPAPSATPAPVESSRSTATKEPERPVYQAPTQSTEGSSTGKWLLGIGVFLGLLWLVSQSGDKTSSPAPTFTPSGGSSSVASPSPSWQSAPSTPSAESRPSEEKPPVGTNNVLTSAQLRYCVAEDIRLEAAKGVINNYNDTHVDRFNEMVADYNGRCGQFRYRSGALESARSEVERFRAALEVDGRARFVRAKAAPSQDLTFVPLEPTPDPTVKAIQERLNELGFDAGVADGLMGERTRTAIAAYQRDRGLSIDGKASKSLLGTLSQAQPEKPAVIAPAVPTQPAPRPAAAPAREGGMPANSELDYSGKSWVCKRGFRPLNGECIAVQIPQNAELDYYGRDWTCKRGFRRLNDGCQVVSIPANAELDYYGRDWTCKRGYRRAGDGCELVQIPQNAELDYYGRDWTCKRGFRRVGDTCQQVLVPQNAELDYYGRDWTCKRGFRKVGDGCDIVRVPENAELDYYGRDWACKRGYRRTGDSCTPI